MSSLPRMILRSAFSSCAARCETAVAVSGDITGILLCGQWARRLRRLQRKLSALSRQLLARTFVWLQAESCYGSGRVQLHQRLLVRYAVSGLSRASIF